LVFSPAKWVMTETMDEYLGETLKKRTTCFFFRSLWEYLLAPAKAAKVSSSHWSFRPIGHGIILSIAMDFGGR
jgi:hypothetical protein